MFLLSKYWTKKIDSELEINDTFFNVFSPSTTFIANSKKIEMELILSRTTPAFKADHLTSIVLLRCQYLTVFFSQKKSLNSQIRKRHYISPDIHFFFKITHTHRLSEVELIHAYSFCQFLLIDRLGCK